MAINLQKYLPQFKWIKFTILVYQKHSNFISKNLPCVITKFIINA